jgi:hypothetical protein
MCTGIALPLESLPVAVLDRHRLRERVYERAGVPELQFHWWHTPAVLPVRLDGRVAIVPWGSKARTGPLPPGGWIAAAHIEAGLLAAARPQPVVIPAALGHHKGTWFLIAEGVRGVVIGSRAGPVVYMLTTKATNYYRNMTEQSPAMPVLVDQVI